MENSNATLEGLIGSLGGTAPVEPTEPVESTEPVDPIEPNDSTPIEGTEDPPAEGGEEEGAPDEGEGKGKGEPKPKAQPDKAAAAFAQMRVQNQRYAKVMKDLATVLQIEDTKNPEAVLNALNEKITELKAKQQGVPVEVLQRLQALEEENYAFTQDQIRRNTYLGFQAVKDTFELTDEELNAFADQLVAEGKNPFETPMDLLAEYRNLNFEALQKKAYEAGLRAEAERAAKAAGHSTQPGKTQGPRGDGKEEKITSYSALTDWFKEQNQ